MTRPAGTPIRILAIAVAAFIGACGTPASAPASAPTSGPASTEPAPSVAADASPSASILRPALEGGATALLELAGTEYRLTGGRCGVEALPADLGGGFVFGLNVGTPTAGDGGPDYLGIVVDVPDGDAPDGTYTDVLATASLGGRGFNIGDAELTISGGGTAGTITGDSRPGNEPLRGTFTC